MESYDLNSIIKEFDDEIMVYQEADLISHPSSSSQLPYVSTLMVENEHLDKGDVSCCHFSSVSRPTTSPTLQLAEPFFNQLAYLASLYRASGAPALLTVAEEDEHSDDDDSLLDDFVCDSGYSATSTTFTTPSSPLPSFNVTCDTSDDIIPLNWLTIAVSNTTSFHTLTHWGRSAT
jgi:hypothetical protein